MDNYIQIIVTVISVLGSASIWKYMEVRLKSRSEDKKLDIENNEGVQYRDDLKNRVINLESLLVESSQDKEELRNQVLTLTAEVNALRVKVEFLEKENDRLKDR
jgi:predicted nuclease with TOPRIM domain